MTQARDVERELLSAICEARGPAREDDAPRLVYADWLAEHGDPERAEFIVLSCDLARSRWRALDEPEKARRQRELLRLHGQRWTEALGGGVVGASFHRGFPERVRIKYEALETKLRTLAKRTPIDSLEIDSRGRSHLEVTRVLAGLRQLHGGVRRLAVTDVLLDHAGASALVHAPEVALVRELDLSGAKLTAGGLDELNKAVAPLDLDRLVVHHPEPRDDLPERAILEAGAFRRTRSIAVSNVPGGTFAIASGSFERLEGLRAPYAPSSAQALSDAAFVPALRVLDLGGATDGRESVSVRAVAKLLSRATRLEDLVLDGWALGDEGGAFLAACRGLMRLESLSIDGTRVRDAGLRALVRSPYLRSLRHVSLCGLHMNGDTRDELRRRFGAGAALHC